MTRIEKSESQNIAEAAAQPLEERDLGTSIQLHRDLYYTDLNWLKQLHVRDGDYGIGVPYSPPFEALLDDRLGGFPWSRAMMDLRHACRATHTGHWDRPEWRGSLCHSLVSLVVRHEYGLDAARFELGLPDEAKTRRTLGNALLSIERHLDESLRREQSRQSQEPRSPSEWMSAAHVHRPLDGLHREECEQCRRVA